MDRLFGLPAHPLLIHFPIVAIPALCLAGLVLVALPNTRDRGGPAIAIFGVITFVSTILAVSSGQEFAELLSSGESISKHRELGETLRLLVGVQTVFIIAMLGVDTRVSIDRRHPVPIILAALVVIFSVLSMIWVIRTGHEGASQSWGFLGG